MAAEPRRADGEVPPASEQIHLPDPSYLPVVTALGISIALVGVVMSWVIFGIGLLIVLVAVVRWIRETRSEIADLPLEH